MSILGDMFGLPDLSKYTSGFGSMAPNSMVMPFGNATTPQNPTVSPLLDDPTSSLKNMLLQALMTPQAPVAPRASENIQDKTGPQGYTISDRESYRSPTPIPPEPADTSGIFADMISGLNKTSVMKPASPGGPRTGMLEMPTVDLTHRPQVQMPDGGIGTVYSKSFNLDGKEVLLPMISPDGQLWDNKQAIQAYNTTGQHLGKFDSIEAADQFAQDLHNQQSEYYGLNGNQGQSQAPQPLLTYANQGAKRNQPLVPGLASGIDQAATKIYGAGSRVEVYSGGQPSTGPNRTGTHRHDGGHAGDVYVYGPDGKQVTGDALAPLAQYWLSSRQGGVGLEMQNGGIHLDDHVKPPNGGGMAWNYANQKGQYTPAQQAAVQKGLAEGGWGKSYGAGANNAEFDHGDYYSRLAGAESGHKANAQNPRSSASGLYQITDSTWANIAKAHPELGLNSQNRFDTKAQDLAVRALTADNEKILQANGIPLTNANRYAAHFLGPIGAKHVLTAPDGAMMSAIVTPGVVSANPFLRSMSVGQFKQWTASKFPTDGQLDSGSLMASSNAGPFPTAPKTAMEKLTERIQKGSAGQSASPPAIAQPAQAPQVQLPTSLPNPSRADKLDQIKRLMALGGLQT